MSAVVYNSKQPGFIAFTSVLVVAAVLLVITTSLGLLSVIELQTTYGWKQGAAASSFAYACIEDALLRLRRVVTYTGSTLTDGTQSCTSVVSGTGANRTITVTATISGPPSYTKDFVVGVKRAGGSVTVTSIQEQ